MNPEDIRNDREDSELTRILRRAASTRRLGQDLREFVQEYVKKRLDVWRCNAVLPSTEEQRQRVLSATLDALERIYQRRKEEDLPADRTNFYALCARVLLQKLPSDLNEMKLQRTRDAVKRSLGLEAVFPYVYVVAGDYREAERLSLAPAPRLQEKIKELTYKLLPIFAEQRGVTLTEEAVSVEATDRQKSKQFFDKEYREVLSNGTSPKKRKP